MFFSSRPVIALLLIGMSLGGCDRQSASKEQANAVTSGEVSGATKAEKAAPYTIDRGMAGSDMPDYAFKDASGKVLTLDHFRGKPVLVNLWATWCAPCIKELPQLDRIAGAYAKSGLQVMPISQDTMEADKVSAFFSGKGLHNLQTWFDPDNNFGFGFGGAALPTSVLYSSDGKEIARIIGAPDWEGDEMRALLEETVNE
ncbi:MAG: TlpA disulfide reductase family protein [Sphingomonadaceae bacterium]